MVEYTINGVPLKFWLEVEQDGRIITCYVQRLLVPGADPVDAAKKFPVFSINSEGECWRHPGLPADMGFMVTTDGKIREVR